MIEYPEALKRKIKGVKKKKKKRRSSFAGIKWVEWPCISIVYDQSHDSMKKSGKIRKYFRLNSKFLELAEIVAYRAVKIIVDPVNRSIGFKFYKVRQEGTHPISVNRISKNNSQDKKISLSIAAQGALDFPCFEDIPRRSIYNRRFFPERQYDHKTGEDIWVIFLDNPGNNIKLNDLIEGINK